MVSLKQNNINRRDFWLSFYCVAVSLLSVVTVWKLPVFAIQGGPDDGLFALWAESMAKGTWLGGFNQLTFCKGPGASIFLCLFHFTGVPLPACVMGIYCISCALFLIAIMPLLKKVPAAISYIVFPLIVFLPTICSFRYIQSTYRPEFMLIFSFGVITSIIAIIIRFKINRNLWGWLIYEGFSLAVLFLVKDDAIWIVPLVFVSSLVFASVLFRNNTSVSKHKIIHFIFLLCKFMTPCIILILVLNITSFINFTNYGFYGITDTGNTNFAKCIKSMYSVEDPNFVDKCSVSNEKLQTLYANSPTLKSIQNELEQSLRVQDSFDSKPGDGNVEDGWFYWGVRGAVSSAGYYDSFSHSEDFYFKVYTELEDSINKGVLETRFTLPSALMSPPSDRYIYELPARIIDANNYVVTLEGISLTYPLSGSNADEPYKTWLSDFFHSSTINYEPGSKSDIFCQFSLNFHNVLLYIYSFLLPLVVLLGFISFCLLIVGYMRSKRKDILIYIIFYSGSLLSLLLLYVGVCYIHISAYNAIDSTYLSYSYGYLLGVSVFLIILFIANLSMSKRLARL